MSNIDIGVRSISLPILNSGGCHTTEECRLMSSLIGECKFTVIIDARTTADSA
jgi:hypothetical protein